jgi:hypothetical protein
MKDIEIGGGIRIKRYRFFDGKCADCVQAMFRRDGKATTKEDAEYILCSQGGIHDLADGSCNMTVFEEVNDNG